MGASSRKNVFVVGAGASAEFLLPTGRQLLNQISSIARPRRDELRRIVGYDSGKIDDALRRWAGEKNGNGKHTESDLRSLQKEAAWISDNAILAPSIDNMLHTHRENSDIVAVGKIMIAAALIEAEKQSTLYFDPRDRTFGKAISITRNARGPGSEQVSAAWTWLANLFWLLAEGRSFAEFIEGLASITFVCFNYDRCIEFFLTNASASYFRLAPNDVELIYEAINLIRPYGTLGNLVISGGEARGFGETSDLFQVSKGIRVFTEEADYTEVRIGLHQAFSEAEMVMFLGFGFIPLNMSLMFAENQYRIKRVLGTSKDFSDESRELLSNDLIDQLMLGSKPGRSSQVHRQAVLKKLTHKFDLPDETCAGLLRRHQVFLRTATA